ncbi:MAG: rhodanese-like domain-containing protein [Sphingobacteriales bacterium]|nr:MAG: rhodanese-like domain-containing protein [Sphingobacteriales bacterium]
MFSQIRQFFGGGPAVDYRSLQREGALIIDVRSESEFNAGHLGAARNVPLSELLGYAEKLPKDKPLILCCASGIRSATARKLLQSKGFSRVYNGGGWQSLRSKLQ